jgi:hypothetical protein
MDACDDTMAMAIQDGKWRIVHPSYINAARRGNKHSSTHTQQRINALHCHLFLCLYATNMCRYVAMCTVGVPSVVLWGAGYR